MEYKPYPTSKDTPQRRSRKSSRHTIFRHNAQLAAQKRRARRDARRAAEGE